MGENKNKLTDLVKQKDKLEAKIVSAMKKAFPIGSEVVFERSGNIIYGTVNMHGHTERMRIKSRTGCVYWVELSTILRGVGGA